MYTAKVLENKNPGGWADLVVGVFRDNEQIGQYTRNYALMNTFHPFTLDGKDYALYSPHYTCTRLMELPSCQDLGGEEPHGSGFCPVDFYVPEVRRRVFPKQTILKDGTEEKYFVNCEYDNEKGYDDPEDEPAISQETTHLPFGFVEGCVWGDDTSSKIEHLDLSVAAQGKLIRTKLVGYREIPPWLGLRLKQCVHFIDFHTGFLTEEECATARIKDWTSFRFQLAIVDSDYYDWITP